MALLLGFSLAILRDGDAQSVKFRRHGNLASETRGFLKPEGEIEHVVLVLARRARPVIPVVIDDDVAGGAGQTSPAGSLDAQIGVASGLHHADTLIDGDLVLLAVRGGEYNLRHSCSHSDCFEVSWRRAPPRRASIRQRHRANHVVRHIMALARSAAFYHNKGHPPHCGARGPVAVRRLLQSSQNLRNLFKVVAAGFPAPGDADGAPRRIARAHGAKYMAFMHLAR